MFIGVIWLWTEFLHCEARFFLVFSKLGPLVHNPKTVLTRVHCKELTEFPYFQMSENKISRKINISNFIAEFASPAYKKFHLKTLHKKNILELQIFCHIWCFIRVPIAHCASHFRFFEMQCTLCNSHFQNFSFWKLT